MPGMVMTDGRGGVMISDGRGGMIATDGRDVFFADAASASRGVTCVAGPRGWRTRGWRTRGRSHDPLSAR